ncbi:MAG: glycosyltransferase family 2 protein [Solirubrobacteraceae bacterium]
MTAGEQTAITVVIVTYRSADVLAGCLASIPAAAEVIVVSQDAADDDVRGIARRERPDARVIASGRNRGFGAGCNLGAANANGEVVIFLNPDARFRPGCAERLAETTLANGGTLTGPRILDSDGRDITRARNWSSPWTDAIDLLVPLKLQPGRWRRDIPPHEQVYEQGGAVPYVQGACMAVGRERFAKLGGFDEELFLFGEEEYLALRLTHEGLSAMLEPRAVATHAEHTSLAKTPGFAVEQYHRTRALSYRRNRSCSDVGLAIGALRSLPLVTVLLFLLVSSPIRTTVGVYRPVENAAWCRAALRGLLAGLLRQPVSGPDPAR